MISKKVYTFHELQQMKDKQLYEKATNRACNTDCLQYRQGTCPFRWCMKLECSRFRVYYEHIKDNPTDDEEDS